MGADFGRVAMPVDSMGQHLSLFASKDIPLEAARAWISARAYDIIRYPTPEEQEHLDRHAAAFRAADRYEDGPCIRPPSSEFVWQAFVVTPEVVAMARGNSPLEAFLAQRLGYVIWGDNDGV